MIVLIVMQRIEKQELSYKPTLTDFPGFIADARCFIQNRHQFTIHGGRAYNGLSDIKKKERVELFAEVFKPLVQGSRKIIAYPYLEDAKDHFGMPVFRHCGNQWVFSGSLQDLVGFLISQAYKGNDNYSLTFLFEFNTGDVDWQAFFGNCFDPMLLNNPSALCSASALKRSKLNAEKEKVSVILLRQPVAYPEFLIESAPSIITGIFEIASRIAFVTDRYQTMYNHLRNA